MNIVLAIVLMSIINMSGVSVSKFMEDAPVIGWIVPESPAEKANLQVDDEILSINNKKIVTWSDVELAVGRKPKRTIDIVVRRGEDVLTIPLLTESKTQYAMGYAGFSAKIWAQVMMVTTV